MRHTSSIPRVIPVCVLCAGLLAVTACEDDVYDLVALGDAGPADLPRPDLPPCTQTNNGKEICDGVDNDCDGAVDEDFDRYHDSRHCGKCNFSCALKESITGCMSGKCKFNGCAPDHWDLNKDLAKGWDEKADGCEYFCKYTGQEKCDNKDNDCDGKIDEDFTLHNDKDNCGKCGTVCKLAFAVAKCVASKCQIQSCDPGYIDKDGKADNGCEMACAKTNGGVEKCDGKDNDCNGYTDDVDTPKKPIDHKTDKNHCGGCDIACNFTNAVGICVAGKCSFSGCVSPWIDADKNSSNGCECKMTKDPKEICDGEDNDCDGYLDKDSKGKALIQSCYTGTSGEGKGTCKSGTQTCSNGTWGPCQGQVIPAKEYCDGKDTDCDTVKDAQACVFAGAGRERRLDEPQLSLAGSANSTQLAVASKGDRLLAVWVDRRKKQSDIHANLSVNGGKSWQSSSDIAVATESNNKLEPQVAFGGVQGGSYRAYVVYEKFVVKDPYSTTPGLRNVYLRRSTNGGQSWGSPVAVKSGSNNYDALYVRLGVLPGGSGQPDRVVVCWEQISVTGSVNPNIYCRMSLNSGSSFNVAVKVNNSANNAILPRMALDAQYLYLTWQQGQNIMVDRSPLTYSNLSFGGDTQLANGAGQEPRILAPGDKRVIVVWEDLRGSLVDIRANTSVNYGGSWLSQDRRIDLDPNKLNGDSTRPTIAARPNGTIFVAWEDTIRGKHDIYINSSSDNGSSWGDPAAQVPTNSAGSVTSRNPHVALEPTGKNVYVAWDDYRNGSHRDVYFSVSLDDGKSWNVPDYRLNEAPKGKADARAPMIVIATSRVAVLWLDNRYISGGVTSTGSNTDIYSSYLE